MNAALGSLPTIVPELAAPFCTVQCTKIPPAGVEIALNSLGKAALSISGDVKSDALGGPRQSDDSVESLLKLWPMLRPDVRAAILSALELNSPR